MKHNFGVKAFIVYVSLTLVFTLLWFFKVMLFNLQSVFNSYTFPLFFIHTILPIILFSIILYYFIIKKFKAMWITALIFPIIQLLNPMKVQGTDALHGLLLYTFRSLSYGIPHTAVQGIMASILPILIIILAVQSLMKKKIGNTLGILIISYLTLFDGFSFLGSTFYYGGFLHAFFGGGSFSLFSMLVSVGLFILYGVPAIVWYKYYPKILS